MKHARQGWNAAKLASERPLQKPRKMHGPVGPQVSICKVDPVNEDTACRGCGYHVCSCEPVEPVCPAGSTDICVRCLLDRGDGRNCKCWDFCGGGPTGPKLLNHLEAAAACRERGKVVKLAMSTPQGLEHDYWRWSSILNEFCFRDECDDSWYTGEEFPTRAFWVVIGEHV